MEPEAMQVLSALVDAEPVDPGELAQVLETAEGRAVLVDFVRLRRAVRDEESAPGQEAVEQARARLRPVAPLWRVVRATAAAAVFALALLGALDLGGLIRIRPEAEAPPSVAREVPFEAGVDWKPVSGGPQ